MKVRYLSTLLGCFLCLLLPQSVVVAAGTPPCTGCEECVSGVCVDNDAFCSGCCDDCVNGVCVGNDSLCSGCCACPFCSCTDDDSYCSGCCICVGCWCFDSDPCCTGCESCVSCACVDDDNNCTGCQSCNAGVCEDNNDNCHECEECVAAVCTDIEGCDCPSDTCTSSELGEDSTWQTYDGCGIPDDCDPDACDGPDEVQKDDCNNKLEVSCAQKDGTGGFGGCAYRYFYNDELISSCIWSTEAENLWQYTYKTSGDGEEVYSKLRHVTQDLDCDEGCVGYSCAKVEIYDCFTCEKAVYWRRTDCSSPPPGWIFDETSGEECPGH